MRAQANARRGETTIKLLLADGVAFGVLVVKEEDVLAYLNRSLSSDQIAKGELTADAPVGVATAAGASPYAAGRPRTYDWEGCMIEALCFIHNNGRPKTQTELAKHLAKWFDRNQGSAPAMSELMKRVGRIFRAMDQL
jgi:hypothetical protein